MTTTVSFTGVILIGPADELYKRREIGAYWEITSYDPVSLAWRGQRYTDSPVTQAIEDLRTVFKRLHKKDAGETAGLGRIGMAGLENDRLVIMALERGLVTPEELRIGSSHHP